MERGLLDRRDAAVHDAAELVEHRQRVEPLPYSEFEHYLKEGKVAEVWISDLRRAR